MAYFTVRRPGPVFDLSQQLRLDQGALDLRLLLARLALPCLIGVERGFFSLEISDRFFGPISRDLIAYRNLQASIALNRFVNLGTLLAHA